jgi:hypothetical protein
MILKLLLLCFTTHAANHQLAVAVPTSAMSARPSPLRAPPKEMWFERDPDEPFSPRPRDESSDMSITSIDENLSMMFLGTPLPSK